MRKQDGPRPWMYIVLGMGALIFVSVIFLRWIPAYYFMRYALPPEGIMRVSQGQMVYTWKRASSEIGFYVVNDKKRSGPQIIFGEIESPPTRIKNFIRSIADQEVAREKYMIHGSSLCQTLTQSFNLFEMKAAETCEPIITPMDKATHILEEGVSGMKQLATTGKFKRFMRR